MANEIKLSELQLLKDLNDVDKILVGTSDGSFGVITLADLRTCLVNLEIVIQRVTESLPEGEIIATFNNNETNTN